MIDLALAITTRHQHALLAQSGSGAGEVVLWGSIIIAIILVGGLIVFQIRKKLLQAEGGGGLDDPFGLQELRELKKSGQISEQEYQTLRTKVIEQVKGSLSEDNASDEPAAPARPASPTRRPSSRSDGFDRP